MNPQTRLLIGTALLAIGLLLPLGVLPLARTDWPAAVKTALGGILFFGFEIMAIPAVAVMGKENFERLLTAAKRWVKSLKPAGEVGRVRHAIGLVLFVAPLSPPT